MSQDFGRLWVENYIFGQINMVSILTSGCDCTVVKCTVLGKIFKNISDSQVGVRW